MYCREPVAAIDHGGPRRTAGAIVGPPEIVTTALASKHGRLGMRTSQAHLQRGFGKFILPQKLRKQADGMPSGAVLRLHGIRCFKGASRSNGPYGVLLLWSREKM